MKRFQAASITFFFLVTLALIAGLAWLSSRDDPPAREAARAAARRNRGAAEGGESASPGSKVRDFKRGRKAAAAASDQSVRGKLSSAVDVSLHGMTVPQALEFLGDLTGLDFRLTEAAVRAGAERRNVGGRYMGIPFASVLSLALSGIGLAWRVSDGVVWIGTRSEGPLDPAMLAAEMAAESEEVQAIREKLETTKIDLDFTDATLYDIIDFIQEFAKINIVIASDVRRAGIPDRKISFAARDLLLKHALKLLLNQYGLTQKFENRVLLITRPPAAEGAPALEIHDLRDLLEPDAAGETHAGDIVDRLMREVAPESWSDRAGEVSISLTGEGQLLVVHSPEVQEQIRQALTIIRDERAGK
ncbi:MAG: hypothetical protein HYY18_04360 [Planctomycetes bacterium]|nr:hypothetical protein [Planctomycetota bacterium]